MAKIAFIGGGNMATCIFDGIVSARTDDEIVVSGPNLDHLAHFVERAQITTSNVDAFNQSDIIFFGVKPQVLPTVVDELVKARVDFANKLLISMAAGVRFAFFYKHFGACSLIRIMPNTPSKIKQGVTALAVGEGVSDEQQQLCASLLEPMSRVIITDEEGINALGALAGSAPAFIYRFMEAMIDECMRHGFSEAESRGIIEEVFLGTSNMVIANHEIAISSLREAVTSKGGTTFQGLAQMSNYKFEEMIHETIEACLRRTREFEDMFK